MSADTPERSLKQTLRQKRVEFILEAAEEVLLEKGYHDASMDEIATRTGISKGTLYQHFSTKEELIFALIDQSLSRFEQLVGDVAVAPLSVQSKLMHILRAVYGEQYGLRTQLLRLLQRDEELYRRLRERKEQLHARLDQARNQIETILEEGKSIGVFDPNISTVLMLHSFLYLLSLKSQESLFTQKQLSPEETIAQIERLFFDGIMCKPVPQTDQ